MSERNEVRCGQCGLTWPEDGLNSTYCAARTAMDECEFLTAVLAENVRLQAGCDRLWELLHDAAHEYTRHPDYDWDIYFAREVNIALAAFTSRPNLRHAAKLRFE